MCRRWRSPDNETTGIRRCFRAAIRELDRRGGGVGGNGGSSSLILQVPRHVDKHHPAIAALEQRMPEPLGTPLVQNELPPMSLDDFRNNDRNLPPGMLLLDSLDQLQQRIEELAVRRMDYFELRGRKA